MPAEKFAIAQEMYPFPEFWDQINSGDKTLEIRVGYPKIRRLTEGKYIRFHRGQHSQTGQSCITIIRAVRVYTSFTHMLMHEKPERINAAAPQNVLDDLHRIYPPEKERFGIYVLEIEKVT